MSHPATERNDGDILLEARGLHVSYGATIALDNASVTLRHGRITGLVGMNGSGKSTLFKTLMGLIEPQPSPAARTPERGQVRFPAHAPVGKARNFCAYVPQSEAVDWNFPLTVAEVLGQGRRGCPHRSPGWWRRGHSTADRRAIAAALRRTGLQDLAGRQIGQLSGGQRKRAFVARGLVQDADILLLDEPFAGVDAASEISIAGVLREVANSGVAILVSIHDLHTIDRLVDDVLLLNRRSIAQGPVERVLTHDNLRAAFGEGIAR
ncbi:metal ABC transporter ATP-binding protein [Corynebacterium heidelbergense]|uniref:ABC transporter domain-containing protein n=1 Tax=Corynebacterium heidelbergense TaxID=2055947 RepID=A0A364V439_9CORY|nr:metal ABC transporter ATP-binding protein [Corynebacterium heidelbergense]RAV31404.1 hypothetical protein DLJ54_08530 [Corynebacterium heidelbergense]